MADAHAPGKLVLCGEYAVLHGAPAIAMAVPVEAHASVQPTAASRLAVAGSGEWAFEWQADGRPRWRSEPPAGQGAVLAAVGAELASRGVRLESAAIVLDTRDFSTRLDDGTVEKLGLGSSAAVTVALVRALLRASHAAAASAPVLEIARAAHQRLQGGGSGIDVAVAVQGGVVAMHGEKIESLPWPEGLHAVALWSGRGASTPDLVARFESWRASQPDVSKRLLAAMAEASSDTLDAWRRGHVGQILAGLARYAELLGELDAAARIGIITPRHAELAREAQAVGAVYKTSGAGGGDFGIAFASRAIGDGTTFPHAGKIILSPTSWATRP